MGHEIDSTAGRYSFADSRNDAWHQLGQQVGHEMARNARIERVTQVMEVMRHSPSITPFAGTAYAAYNAVTEYADHFMPLFGKGGDAAARRANRTITSADVHKIKSDAYAGLTKALPLTTDQVLRWGPVVATA